MPTTTRKKSPTSVIVEGDESKYEKRPRGVRTQSGRRTTRTRRPRLQHGQQHGQHRRLSWSTFGVLYCAGTLLLLWRLSSDSASHRSKLLELERWNRAMKLQRQRGGSGAGHGLRNRKNNRFRKKRGQDDSQGDDTENDDQEAAASASTSSVVDEIRNIDHDIVHNVAGGIRYIRPHLLPPLPGQPDKETLAKTTKFHYPKRIDGIDPFRAVRKGTEMAWLQDANAKHLLDDNTPVTPRVDYTKHAYVYPPLLDAPPTKDDDKGSYPPLEPLGDILTRWPQNKLDDPPSPIVERLLHFNYSNPSERAAALEFRNAELPFKLYDVPEVTAAGVKWTDDYVSEQFDGRHFFGAGGPPRSQGKCQESPNHFFAFYTPPLWRVETMGAPPTRNNDWSFSLWARHANYADVVGLSEDQPHFYWQAGIPKEERYQPQRRWTFVSRDLPSFSSTDETFFCFHPQEQKGIQCRFGERGVTAATHYDSGRNMVAMVTGAKRYILSPPRECSKLGVVTERDNSIYRHSLLNFGNLEYLNITSNSSGENGDGDDNGDENGDDNGDDEELDFQNENNSNTMSADERAWLEKAKDSMAVDTVLKAGEVLYIPSHWFHYITSVQKSAQCNVRSGIDTVGTPEFGGAQDVRECVDSEK